MRAEFQNKLYTGNQWMLYYGLDGAVRQVEGRAFESCFEVSGADIPADTLGMRARVEFTFKG